ncbi:MAG: hypothetical protein JNL96_18285 [Planctomycetaceae bacterium]|nr:hypothetical protein [Planctomycetaceae bacterium]
MLDVGGMLPVVGVGFDTAAAGFALGRGDWVGLGLSVPALIPFVGDATAGTAKLSRWGIGLASNLSTAMKAGGQALVNVGVGIRRVGERVAFTAIYHADSAVLATRHALDKYCFSPETLVTTAAGRKRLDEVQPGEFVQAFDHAEGCWRLAEVLARHDNRFTGNMVTVVVEGELLEATERHPFWVVVGEELYERPPCDHLLPHEDDGGILPGRWVDSHLLQPGDVLVGLDGERRVVESVAIRAVENQPVTNLTVRDQHTFAVGPWAVLVHNEAWCGLLGRVSATYITARAQLAKLHNLDIVRIHGHHIVQKLVPRQYAAIKGFSKVQEGWSKSQQMAWYIGKSQDILAGKVDLLDDFKKASGMVDLVKAGKTKFYNLTLAVNGKGTHSLETVKAVYELLDSAAGSKRGIQRALAEIGEVFMEHGTYLDPITMRPWAR